MCLCLAPSSKRAKGVRIDVSTNSKVRHFSVLCQNTGIGEPCESENDCGNGMSCESNVACVDVVESIGKPESAF